MPLPGGSSDKYGNRYEDRWTAQCAFDVLRETSLAIRSEPPGPEGEGMEFWIDYPDRREYHQVKRQRASEGRWTIGALQSAGVLEVFYDKLRQADAHCVFVSSHAAYTLEELADRARKAESFAEYERDLLGGGTWQAHFDDLRRCWGNIDAVCVWNALLRVRTVTLSERELAWANGLAAELVLEGDYEPAIATLIGVLRDRVNERLTPHVLWQALAERGVKPNTWSNVGRAAVLLSEANERYRSSRRTMLIGGELVERPQVAELAGLLEGHSVVVLDGPAGMGKSDVLLGLSDLLLERKVPHLVFRLDRLAPTARPELLGQELGLPASPPAVLASVAQGQQSVLVIDQLDMVSTSSGRNPQFFECVDALLRLAAAEPEMRVVLACRTFDLDNDTRLRALVHGQDKRPVVSVAPFDHGYVREVVGALGFDAGALEATQLDLLGVPLNLALLTEIAASSTERELRFATRRDLYDAFWKHKRRDVDERLGRQSQWTEVIDQLIDRMSEQQALRAPCELVDQWESDAEAMASSHVLVRDRGSYAFFHETFFDYLFARRFITRGNSLRRLLAGDQLLFRRAQVRQVLTHERDGDFTRYIDDLAYLLNDGAVRLHIRDLVLVWLGGISVITDEEWRLIKPLLHSSDEALRERAWRLLCSPSWFRYADDHGAVEEWLAAGGDIAKRARWLAGQVIDAFPRRVAALLAPLMDASDEERRDVAAILSHADLATDRALFDLFLRLLAEPYEEGELASQNFWHIAYGLLDAHPDWGGELLGHYLTNRVAAARRMGIDGPFRAGNGLIPYHVQLWNFAPKCAARAPLVFVEHVWPPVLSVIRQTAEEVRDDRLSHDEIWPMHQVRDVDDVYPDLDDAVLLGLEAAFAGLARDEPAQFTALVAEHADTHYESVVHFIFHGFAGNPECFADQAVDFLLTDPRRFQISYSSDETRQLLAAVTPHCSDDALERLSAGVMAFHPAWERSIDGHREHGLAQFRLLTDIDTARWSAAVRKRYKELQRKFGEAPPEPPDPFGPIHSPIPIDATEIMTDEQWQSALARYDEARGDDPRDVLKGGAHALSSVLERHTTDDPVRFATLALTLPDETHPSYFDAVLRGIGASDHSVPLDLSRDLCVRCHELPGRPCGMSIGIPMMKHADDELPNEFVELLSWYAIKARDPKPDQDRGEEGNGEQCLRQGLNSVRGTTAGTIAYLVHTREDNLERLRLSIEALASNRSMAVRAMAARIPLALLRYHRDDALALFETLVDGAEDYLLASYHVQDFLRYRAAIDFARLKPIMELMVRSELSDVRSAGASWITLAALEEAEAHELARACLTGSEQERLGAAQVYTVNLTQARFREQCEDALQTLFDDDAAEVRKAAASAVTQLDDAMLGDFEPLAQILLCSRAAADHYDDILHALARTTAPVPGLALNACEGIIQHLWPDAVATRSARELVEILVRAYADSDRAAALRERALDLIDLSLKLSLSGAQRALQEHDRE